MEDAGQGGDRRAVDRYLTWYPVHMERPSAEAEIVLVYDISVSGALLLTRARLEMGDAVTLRLDVFGDPNTMRSAPGRVVRAERRPPEVSEVWIYSVGVQFDTPLDDIRPAIEELARKVKAAAR